MTQQTNSDAVEAVAEALASLGFIWRRREDGELIISKLMEFGFDVVKKADNNTLARLDAIEQRLSKLEKPPESSASGFTTEELNKRVSRVGRHYRNNIHSNVWQCIHDGGHYLKCKRADGTTDGSLEWNFDPKNLTEVHQAWIPVEGK